MAELDIAVCKDLDDGETLGWICNACGTKNPVTRATCSKCMTSITYSNQLARAKNGSSLGASQGLVATEAEEQNACQNMVKQRSESGSVWEWVAAAAGGVASVSVSAVKSVGGGAINAASSVSTDGLKEATKSAIASTQDGLAKAAVATGLGKRNAKKD